VTNLTQEQISKRIEELGPWFHNMELGGVLTAPNHFLGNYPEIKWRTFAHAIPEDLTGRTVLDVGCNGGFYSIEMKKRGASRVVAIDSDEDYLAQARFAAEQNHVDVEFHCLSVYQVKELKERFDLVLFMGVLYHLRYPLLALDLLHDYAVGDTMVFQCLQRGSQKVAQLEEDYPFENREVFLKEGYPVAYFVERCYSHDPTNWWIPNQACVEAMLRSSGFDIVMQPEQEVYVCKRRLGRDAELVEL
jgi:tRNA (mo5U34)-methyltransferase